MRQKRIRARGFTLIEMLAALLVLSLLGLMSYRGLGAVLDARDHLKAEAERWQRVQSFFLRFERDLRLAAPRPVASGAGTAAAWLGQTGSRQEPELQLTRFAYDGGADTARRVGYRRNENQEIELWLWPGLDVAPGAVPARYPVLAGVREFELSTSTPASHGKTPGRFCPRTRRFPWRCGCAWCLVRAKNWCACSR